LNKKKHEIFFFSQHAKFTLNSLLHLPLLIPQHIHPQLISLPQDSQRILPLNLRHVSPIADSRQRAILIHNQRAQVVKLDCASARTHIDGYCRILPLWFRQGKRRICRELALVVLLGCLVGLAIFSAWGVWLGGRGHWSEWWISENIWVLDDDDGADTGTEGLHALDVWDWEDWLHGWKMWFTNSVIWEVGATDRKW
jgi:hypothetical protein